MYPGAASAVDAPPLTVATDRQEEVLSNNDGVTVSYVSFLLPLPANAAPHSPQCDRAGFLRYRTSDGPADARDADAVVVQQPGMIGGAVNSDSVAQNTVRSAKTLDRKIEFWAMARRATCLDETFGFDYALQTGNYLDAVNYYFNNMPIDGRTFPGFRTTANLPELDAMGMERNMRDQYEIMLHEMPDQVARQQKYVCAGISMGGLTTGFFSDWDFDGNPATQADAGFNQCAAFAAQDSMVNSDPSAMQNTPFFHDVMNAIVGPINDLAKTGLNVGALPFRTLGPTPVIGTKAMMLYRLAGLAAHLDPDGESQLLANLHDPELEATIAIQGGTDWAGAITGATSIRNFRFTNTALLGMLIDNNGGNLGLLQQGLGALSGGPVVEKTFPAPGSITQIPVLGNYLRMLSGPQTRVSPSDRNVVYTWRNYNDVIGVPWTAPSHETADIHQVAKQLGTGWPSAYWETYFPMRQIFDMAAGFTGARSGDMVNLRYHAMARQKPNFAIYAGDSVVQYGVGTWVPMPALADVQYAPGYTHVDTIGAAAVQNNGKPDYSGQYLAEFIRGITP